jgi:hypothetical protein
MSVHIKRTERSQINDLVLHLKVLEKKQEQAKPKTSRGKEIIKIRDKINEIETQKNHTKNKGNKKLVLYLPGRGDTMITKSWFFGKINKIDRPLANLTK